ncbi:MAG: ABC transporter substrate-binding protein [Clostridiales bacterium]|nr:ABC transporter substrate-binding protein [Clostridiales bacterium]
MAILAIALAVCIVLLPTALYFQGFFSQQNTSPIPPPGPGAGSNGDKGGSGSQALLPPPSVTQWPFPILTAITGNDSREDLAAAWGFDYGIQRVNATGGIRGIPASSVLHDTSGNPDKALTEMTAVTKDALVAFGPTGSENFETVHKAAATAKLPHISSANAPGLRTPFAPYLISCTADPGRDAEGALRLWVTATPAISKLYVFYDTTLPASVSREERVKALLGIKGSSVSLAGSVGVDQDADRQTGAVSTAMATGADAYYLDVNAEDFLFFAGALRAAGVPASSILGGPDCVQGLSDLLATAPDAGTESAVNNLEGVYAYSLTSPEELINWDVFGQAAKGHVDDADLPIAADYVDAVFLVKQAIETLGLTGGPQKLPEERERLAAWLYNTDEIQGALTTYRIENGEKVVLPHLLRLESSGFVAIDAAQDTADTGASQTPAQG